MISANSSLASPSYRTCRYRRTTPSEALVSRRCELWVHVIPHFSKFLKNLELEPVERADAECKAERIAQCLWKKYYQGEFNPQCYVKVGSYGKGTGTRPPSDLDMLFLLPAAEYHRINGLVGNKQSQLLREVKLTLEGTFSTTDLKADGQVVIAPFQTYSVEIIPPFIWINGTASTYITAHTANGGTWRQSDPVTELQVIRYADSVSVGKATDLIKMLKAWKRECSVKIKSISLESLACAFAREWTYRYQTLFYYDWMIRDFFAFLFRYRNGRTFVPGTGEAIELGDEWVSKCESAHTRAIKACTSEKLDQPYLATEEWQKLFGQKFTGSPMFGLPFLLKAMAASR
jgi:hypothetical protein